MNLNCFRRLRKGAGEDADVAVVGEDAGLA